MRVPTDQEWIELVRKNRRWLAPLLVGLLVVLTAWNSFYMVGAGEHAVVFNGAGGSLRESEKGMHLKIPLFEGVTKYETRGQLYTSLEEAASRDLQTADTTVSVLYHPDLGYISQIHLTLGPDYVQRVIVPAVHETVKAITAQYDAPDLVRHRPLVKDDITASLRGRLAEKHIIVDSDNDVSITQFHFSKQYEAAIEAAQVAQQEAIQANNTLQRVTNEAQQKVIQAEADREAANQTAQATVILAQANATAVQVLREQFGTVESYLQWERLREWNGVLPQTLVTNGSAGTSVLVGLP